MFAPAKRSPGQSLESVAPVLLQPPTASCYCIKHTPYTVGRRHVTQGGGGVHLQRRRATLRCTADTGDGSAAAAHAPQTTTQRQLYTNVMGRGKQRGFGSGLQGFEYEVLRFRCGMHACQRSVAQQQRAQPPPPRIALWMQCCADAAHARALQQRLYEPAAATCSCTRG